jgi:hypothetical protein
MPPFLSSFLRFFWKAGKKGWSFRHVERIGEVEALRGRGGAWDEKPGEEKLRRRKDVVELEGSSTGAGLANRIW